MSKNNYFALQIRILELLSVTLCSFFNQAQTLQIVTGMVSVLVMEPVNVTLETVEIIVHVCVSSFPVITVIGHV